MSQATMRSFAGTTAVIAFGSGVSFALKTVALSACTGVGLGTVASVVTVALLFLWAAIATKTWNDMRGDL